MALMIVHRYGARSENAEVLRNTDHILIASRRSAPQGEYTEITLSGAPAGTPQTLPVTEDIGELITGRSSKRR